MTTFTAGYKKLHLPSKSADEVYCSPMKETRIDNQTNSLVGSSMAKQHSMFGFQDVGLDERSIMNSSQDVSFKLEIKLEKN